MIVFIKENLFKTLFKKTGKFLILVKINLEYFACNVVYGCM